MMHSFSTTFNANAITYKELSKSSLSHNLFITFLATIKVRSEKRGGDKNIVEEQSKFSHCTQSSKYMCNMVFLLLI